MKKLLFTTISLAFLCTTVSGKELTDKEAATMLVQLNQLSKSVVHGDIEATLEKTHPSLIAMVGGKEKYLALVARVKKIMEENNAKMEMPIYGKPSKIHPVTDHGNEELVFVPRKQKMTIQDTRMESTGFMIAIRKQGTNDWLFLDGAGTEKNPKMLWQLFPSLDKNANPPQIQRKILEAPPAE